MLGKYGMSLPLKPNPCAKLAHIPSLPLVILLLLLCHVHSHVPADVICFRALAIAEGRHETRIQFGLERSLVPVFVFDPHPPGGLVFCALISAQEVVGTATTVRQTRQDRRRRLLLGMDIARKEHGYACVVQWLANWATRPEPGKQNAETELNGLMTLCNFGDCYKGRAQKEVLWSVAKS